MVLVKKWPFFRFSFLGKLGQKNVFYDILEEKKNPFYSKKTRSSKSQKIDIFPKALTHGFGPKMAIFRIFFLGNLGQENVFYDILERKNAFLRYKNNKFKKSKNRHFSKGVNLWIRSKKKAIFPTFFF